MRRSRRLSGLEPDVVPDVLNPISKRAPAKKKKPATSSSKKENKPPSKSARKTKPTVTRTKRAVSTRTSSQKRTTPKKSTTPKRGRAKPRATTAASARSRSGRSSTSTKSQKKATTQRSRSAKRTKTPKSKKGTTTIHPKTPKQTPVAPRSAEEEPLLGDDEKEKEVLPQEGVPHTQPSTSKSDWQEPTTDTEERPPQPESTGHSLDMTMVGIIVSLLALYIVSFCRSMSCSALTKFPWFTPQMMEFNMGAIVATSFVIYIVSLAYCRKWLQADGFMVAGEGAFITLHFCHGLLIMLHLVSCTMMSPENKQSNCIESIVALSMGFYGAAWAMQLKFSMQFLRNSITLAYVILYYYHQKNVFGYVLLLAAKSVFWMTGAHMMEIVDNDRWGFIDIVVSIGFGFLSFLVPSRVKL